MSSKKKIAALKARAKVQAEKKNMKGREVRSLHLLGDPERVSDYNSPFDVDILRQFLNLHNSAKGKSLRMPIPKDASTKKWSQ